MKELFSISKFDYEVHSFHLITRGKNIIHLTASYSKHEKAIHNLEIRSPDIKFISSTNATPYSDLLHNIINNPKAQIPMPDYDTNPFLSSGTEFQKNIWRLISEIGYGCTTTYKALAEKARVPQGARAVGNACNANPLALIIPCHRVIGVSGLGGYAGGLDIKRKLLEIERVSLKTSSLQH